MGLLDGRVAIVTGGAGNLGAHISRLLAAQGAGVVINDTPVRGQSASSAPSTPLRCWPDGSR
jgi:NAD(P)-dependent dehydrogenase (short-subunit alcohol dehydrogenase family)